MRGAARKSKAWTPLYAGPMPSPGPYTRPSPATSDVPALLRALMADDPGRPRLTWYGPAGERVELSAKVLDNWVAKTANLLVDELDAAPGTRITLALPGHWRTAVWLLAVWACGATVVPGGGSDRDVADGDVLVTTDPDAALSTAPPGGALVVGVALPALAPTFGPGLPDGVVDGNAAVRVHGDVFVPIVRPVPDDMALEAGAQGAGGGSTTHGDLLPSALAAAQGRGWDAGVRVLVPGARATIADAVTWLLAPLAVGGSVVLVGDPASGTDVDVERIAAQEAVTAHLP